MHYFINGVCTVLSNCVSFVIYSYYLILSYEHDKEITDHHIEYVLIYTSPQNKAIVSSLLML